MNNRDIEIVAEALADPELWAETREISHSYTHTECRFCGEAAIGNDVSTVEHKNYYPVTSALRLLDGVTYYNVVNQKAAAAKVLQADKEQP